MKRDNILSYNNLYRNENDSLSKDDSDKVNYMHKSPEEKIIENYVIEMIIDKNDYSKVVLGKHIITGEKVAIKILNKKLFKNNILTLKRIKKEIQILKIVKHENIINLLEKIENKDAIYLVTEYYPNDLLTIVEKNTHKKLSEGKALYYFFQYINGLHYLHENNICHRNIRPDNILLDENNSKLKIIDFGLSTLYFKNELLNSPVGSILYAPPEMHLSEKYSGELADIWNAGLVLYFMVCGYLPFSEEDEEKNINHIITGFYEIPPDISNFCAEIIRSCLQVNPNKRINLEKLGEFINYSKGLIVGINIIPIDEKVIFECKKYLGYFNNNEKIEEIKESVKNNKCDEFSALYYLVMKKMVRNGYESISDLSSNKFKNYINDTEVKNESSIIYKQKTISNFILKKNDINYINRSYKNNMHNNNKSLNIPSFKNQIIYSPMIIKSYNDLRPLSQGKIDLKVRNKINSTVENDSNISCKNIERPKIKLDNLDNNYIKNNINSISPKIDFKRSREITFSKKNFVKKELLKSYSSWKNKKIKKDVINRFNITENNNNVFNRNTTHVINSTILTSMKKFKNSKNKKERNNSDENKVLFYQSNNYEKINKTLYNQNKNYNYSNKNLDTNDENNDLINILTEDKPLENFNIDFNFNNINKNINSDRSKNTNGINTHKYKDYHYNYNKSFGNKLRVRNSTIIHENSNVIKNEFKFKKFLNTNNAQNKQNENKNIEINLSHKDSSKIINNNNNIFKNINIKKQNYPCNKLVNNSFNTNIIHRKNNSALLKNIFDYKNKKTNNANINVNIEKSSKEINKEIENGNIRIYPFTYRRQNLLENYETGIYDIGVFDLNCLKIDSLDNAKQKINKVLKNKKINYTYVKNNKYRCSKLGNFFDIEASALDTFLSKFKNNENNGFVPLTKRNATNKKVLIYFSFRIKKNDIKKTVNNILKQICI